MRLLKKVLKSLLVIFIVIVVLDVGLLAFFTFYRPAIKKADAIVVLGAAINTPALYNRSLTGLRLYQQGKADLILASGGKISDEDISEAAYMQKVIRKNSTTTVPVILEDQSHTTFENIKNAKAKAPQIKSIIVVSDEFHLARAVLVALRNGYLPVYWDAPEPTYYRRSELFYYYFREGVALIDYLPKLVVN